MADNKKTMRHFYCRDVLWDTFSQMSKDFSVSIDYLINEAMRYFAKSKGYWPQEGTPGEAKPNFAAYPATREVRMPMRRTPSGPMPIPGSTRRPSSVHTPLDFIDDESPKLTLHLIYEGEKIPVDKDQFVIGRVHKACDLAIKDINISRRHAAIVRRGGHYYIKDLNSTNGIEYNGTRIDNKRIDEGDVFDICGHKIRFTYR